MKNTHPHLHRVLSGTLERLEPCARKRARTVLRGGWGGNAPSLLCDDSRLTSVTDNGNNTWSYQYDEVGERIAQMDPNGHVTRFAFDRTDRMVSRTLPGPNVPASLRPTLPLVETFNSGALARGSSRRRASHRNARITA